MCTLAKSRAHALTCGPSALQLTANSLVLKHCATRMACRAVIECQATGTNGSLAGIMGTMLTGMLLQATGSFNVLFCLTAGPIVLPFWVIKLFPCFSLKATHLQVPMLPWQFCGGLIHLRPCRSAARNPVRQESADACSSPHATAVVSQARRLAELDQLEWSVHLRCLAAVCGRLALQALPSTLFSTAPGRSCRHAASSCTRRVSVSVVVPPKTSPGFRLLPPCHEQCGGHLKGDHSLQPMAPGAAACTSVNWV